jgi:hypothetical protein
MNVIFVLLVVATYSAVLALTRRPSLPWVICTCLFLAAAMALTFGADLADTAAREPSGIPDEDVSNI